MRRIKRWLGRGNERYPVHLLNILGLIGALNALAVIVVLGPGDVYFFLLMVFCMAGGLYAWLYRFK